MKQAYENMINKAKEMGIYEEHTLVKANDGEPSLILKVTRGCKLMTVLNLLSEEDKKKTSVMGFRYSGLSQKVCYCAQ